MATTAKIKQLENNNIAFLDRSEQVIRVLTPDTALAISNGQIRTAQSSALPFFFGLNYVGAIQLEDKDGVSTLFTGTIEELYLQLTSTFFFLASPQSAEKEYTAQSQPAAAVAVEIGELDLSRDYAISYRGIAVARSQDNTTASEQTARVLFLVESGTITRTFNSPFDGAIAINPAGDVFYIYNTGNKVFAFFQNVNKTTNWKATIKTMEV